MKLWARAWAISRHVGPPVPAPGGWKTEVGLPDQLRRYTFPVFDPAILRPLAESVTQPCVLFKVCTDEAKLRAGLPAHWQVRQGGYMMVDDAPAGPVAVLPPTYALTVDHAPPFIRVQILKDGEIACSGQAILVDDIAVYDQIGTEGAYRRLGLARTLMLTLKALVTETGAKTGVLSSSRMGKELYLSLGWRQLADYTTGASPGTPPLG